MPLKALSLFFLWVFLVSFIKQENMESKAKARLHNALAIYVSQCITGEGHARAQQRH